MLEESLGSKLFERRTRALLLTEKGQTYYREISQLLEKLREATTELTGLQTNGTLIVTTTVTFASLWLVPRLSGLQQQHPEIRVHLAADNKIQDLKKEQFDLAIRYSTRKMAGTGAQKLFGESVAPVCSPNYSHATPSPARRICRILCCGITKIRMDLVRGSRGMSGSKS
jgi:LysR family glycine cleavage system transcriptional activator